MSAASGKILSRGERMNRPRGKKRTRLTPAKAVFFALAVLAFALIFVHAAQAVPAYHGPVNLRQPDGTSVKARQIGDEFTNFVETADGLPVVVNKLTGFWEYGRLDAVMGLIPSGLVAGRDFPSVVCGCWNVCSTTSWEYRPPPLDSAGDWKLVCLAISVEG